MLGTVALLTSAPGFAVAGDRGPVGFAGIRAASLRQHGRRLRWTVVLAHGLSGESIAAGRRSVCLLLERRTSGAVDAQLCVVRAGRSSGRLRLELSPVSAAGVGRRRPVAAAVRRDGRTLTASFTPASIGRRYRSLRWQVRSTATGTACAPARAGRGGCTVLRPRRPALARLHVPRLIGCAPRGDAVVYGGPSHAREIALTFDDGPWWDPPAGDFVNLLAREHVPATFFEIGDQIAEYDPTGALERRMLADGDMIGDHTWTHPQMTALSPAAQTTQLQRTAAAIRARTGFTPCLWRPPYGLLNGRLVGLARGLGFETVDWDVDPRDWSLPGVGAIERTVIDTAQNGSIVELHFGGGPRLQTLDALPTIIGALRARGYRFVNLAQMLGLRMVWR